LAQRAEISLQEEKKKKEPVTPSPTPTAKSKKTQRIKALSPKVQRDEQLEVECITYGLFSVIYYYIAPLLEETNYFYVVCLSICQ
jgi:hypothetical protein